MTQITFLGLGAMGARMAHKLIEAGYDVCLWNRTKSAAEPLELAGAVIRETPRQAVEGADIVFSMVRDDAASRQIWLADQTGALAGMKAGTVGIECSTLGLHHVKQLAEEFHRKGLSFLDAPVAGSRPQAESGQLIFLVGGRATVLRAVEPVLQVLGSAVLYAGDNGAGATVKLMINGLFGVQLAAVAELIGLACAAGLDPKTAIDIVGATPVCSPAVKMAANAMLAGAFAPAFPIDLVAKDFLIARNVAEELGVSLPVTNAAGAIYEKGNAAGLAGDNITGIVQLYQETTPA